MIRDNEAINEVILVATGAIIFSTIITGALVIIASSMIWDCLHFRQPRVFSKSRHRQ